MIYLRASSLGRTADRLLAAGSQLLVQRVFRSAIHAIGTQGELLVLTNDPTRAPWVINIPDLESNWAAPHDVLLVSTDRCYLHAPSGLPIRIDAPIWTPIALGPPAVPILVRQLLSQLDLPSAAPGLADTAPTLLANLRLALVSIATYRAPGYQCLCESIGMRQSTSNQGIKQSVLHAALEPAIQPLIGLGRGLTPAGDDLLTGLFGVLVLIGHPQLPQLPFPSDYAKRTSLPAATQLLHALRGELPEPLHNVIRSVLLADVNVASIAIRQLTQLGSSSGLDMLAGVRLGIEALLTGWYR